MSYSETILFEFEQARDNLVNHFTGKKAKYCVNVQKAYANPYVDTEGQEFVIKHVSFSGPYVLFWSGDFNHERVKFQDVEIVEDEAT